MKSFLWDDTLRLGTFYRYLVIKKLQLPVKGKNVLDIGGYDGYILSNIEADSKTLIDTDPVNVYETIRYIKSDFFSHDLGNAQYDRVFAFDVLEHIREERSFIAKMLNILAPGGLAILSTPSKNIKIFPSFLQSFVDKKWGHIYRRGFTADELKALIDTGDVDYDVTLTTWNCPAFRLFYLPLSLLWRLVSGITTKILQSVVDVDYRYKAGNNGFLFVTLRKK